jgi:hypothetical protein
MTNSSATVESAVVGANGVWKMANNAFGKHMYSNWSDFQLLFSETWSLGYEKSGHGLTEGNAPALARGIEGNHQNIT